MVAIIGDGAFTGGMVYEGMNNIGKLDNLMVILNDNKMSISTMSAHWQGIWPSAHHDPLFHGKGECQQLSERSAARRCAHQDCPAKTAKK